MKLDDALADLLRERGASEDMLRWLQHPEAVQTLLRGAVEGMDDAGYVVCDSCDVRLESGAPHDKACEVVEAWRVLRDGRFDEEFSFAWDAAIEQHRARYNYAPRSPVVEEYRRSYAEGLQFAGMPVRVSDAILQTSSFLLDAAYHAPLAPGPSALPQLGWRRYNEGTSDDEGQTK